MTPVDESTTRVAATLGRADRLPSGIAYERLDVIYPAALPGPGPTTTRETKMQIDSTHMQALRCVAAIVAIAAAMAISGCGTEPAEGPDRSDEAASSGATGQPTPTLAPDQASACAEFQADPFGADVTKAVAKRDRDALLADLAARKIRFGTLSVGKCGDRVVIHLGIAKPVDVPAEGAEGTPILLHLQPPITALSP